MNTPIEVAIALLFIFLIFALGRKSSSKASEKEQVPNDTVETEKLVVEANTATDVPSKATVEAFCLALRDFEGKPGDRNYKNNNPGNCKFSPVGYLPKYEPVRKDKDGFAIFKDYPTGFSYLKNMVRARIYMHPNQTIEEFMYVYAPPSDNNPTKEYARFIGKRLGVNSSKYLMKNLV